MTIFVVKIRNDEFSMRILSLMFISKIQIMLKVFKNLENSLFKIIRVLIIELLKTVPFIISFARKHFFKIVLTFFQKERRRDRREGGRREGGFRENFRGDGDGYRDRRPDRRSDRKDRRRSDRPRDQNNNDDLMVSLSSHLCSSVLGA